MEDVAPSELAILYGRFLDAVKVEDIDGATQVRNVIVDQYPRLSDVMDAILKDL